MKEDTKDIYYKESHDKIPGGLIFLIIVAVFTLCILLARI